MNVSQQNKDNVNAVVTIAITKADYQESVEKALRTYRQKANIPGFRKGMVPMGMIQKMYGKSILLEEVNRVVSNSLMNYIRENNLNILGEPMPSEDQQMVDFDTQEDFEFSFDIALAPEVKIDLTKKDKVTYYEIPVTDEMVEKQIEGITSRYGKQEKAEEADENALIKGKLVQVEKKGVLTEGGIIVEEAVLSPKHFKAAAEKKKFIGAKVGETIFFNPSKAVDGNTAELAAMLHIEKDAAEDMKASFEMEITEILSFKPAEINQELFDMVYGKDEVKSEAEFKERVKAMLAEQLQPEVDYRFSIDAREVIEKKVGDLEMPEAFLKRWMVATGENRTAESIDEEWPKMLPELKWHLIKEEIVRQNDIKVEEADILVVAKKATKAQFAQYGMMHLPEEVVEDYARQMLKNKENAQNLVGRATEEKITECVKGLVTLQPKTTTMEDFYKLFETK